MTVIFDNPAAQRRADAAAARGEPALQVRVTLEVLLYVALALLSLALRAAELDRQPLDDAQAHQALAALRAVDDRLPGAALVAGSPLTFVTQALTFGFLPAHEITARLPIALAGVLLTLAPALWRRYLGVLPPLIASALLVISPAALLSARSSSPVVWAMLLALIAPWLTLRFIETRQRHWAVAATTGFAAMVFLAEPAGTLTLLALAFGVLFAWLTHDDPEAAPAAGITRLAREWPWAEGLLAAGGLILVVGTGLFLLPSGLTSVGNAVWSGVRGFVERVPGQPVAFPLWVALRYETGILLFGVLAGYRALREGSFFERALVGWAVAGLVWSLAYAGARPGHALWLTLPLTALVALAVTHWLTERPDGLWEAPVWGVPLHALVTFALWLSVGLSVVLLAKRLMLDLPAGITDLGALARSLLRGVYNRQLEQPDVATVQGVPVFAYVLGYIQLRVLVTVLVSLLNGVLFFLVGSLWGTRVAWRGFALGTLTALLLFSFGLGGRASFDRVSDPRELWTVAPPGEDAFEMRATLREMSLRDTGEPNLLRIAALAPDDGVLAWALRDFPNTAFVSSVGPEVTSAAVLVPLDQAEVTLGADYVGKTLALRHDWSARSLTWQDALMWVYRSDARSAPQPLDELRLWIRSDVYGVERVTED